MTLTEALLIVIIIILIITTISRGRKGTALGKDGVETRQWDCVDRNTGNVTAVKLQYKDSAQTSAANKGAAEMFTNCQDIDTKQALHEMCGDGDKFTYAVNEFGGAGMDFKDWVASQAVDSQVIKNHAEFVKDRLGNDSQNITGRTWAVPDDIEVDQVPWVGLRRPEAVPTCNPTQVPDTNYNWYLNQPKFTWSSS